jgi:hypothetical protein
MGVKKNNQSSKSKNKLTKKQKNNKKRKIIRSIKISKKSIKKQEKYSVQFGFYYRKLKLIELDLFN